MVAVKDSPAGKSAFDRDWTSGSIVRNLLSLSWPMVLNESLWVIGMTVDLIWVGQLGPASIAGVGVAGMVVWMLMVARWGLSTGTRAMVARFVGAGDAAGANHVAGQAFAISAVYAVVVTSVGIFLTEPILMLFNLEAAVVSEGAAYMRIQLIGSLAMSLWMMGEAIMQASGDALRPMKITMAARGLHLILDPFLILGWWIFPRMGVSGAATANLIAYVLGMVLTLWILFSGRSRLRLTLRGFRFEAGIIWRIVKIGVPASIMGMARTFGRMMLLRLVTPFGTLAVAAHILAERIEMFLYLPGWGLGMAGGVLVGQNLGAGQPERAEKSGWLAAGLMEGFIIFLALAVMLRAESIISIFNTDPDFVAMASSFIRIEALGYLVLGFVAVLQMTISGSGDTLPPMLISLLMIWVVQVPLSVLLPRVDELGVYGIRWAIVAGNLAGAVAYTAYFRLGRWKRKKV
ncbi:MAG: MATE family efflux transporter [Dehalococcoidales bacterium]|nr:MATE family efflux transporter [Dehalococcoidales bacterium]MDZ4230916.1 MATE family efflux transporter [Dehalococcoidales bacterium]